MNKIKRLCLCSVLCAAALTVFVIEAQIPIPIPVPGVKLGLANIFTLFALLYLTQKEAAAILFVRIFLGAMYASSPSVLLYSLSGGFVCLIGESILVKLFGKRFICEISVVGAMLHNTAQIACAAVVTASLAVFGYLPFLLIAAAVSGGFCGFCIYAFDKAFGKRILKLLK